MVDVVGDGLVDVAVELDVEHPLVESAQVVVSVEEEVHAHGGHELAFGANGRGSFAGVGGDEAGLGKGSEAFLPLFEN